MSVLSIRAAHPSAAKEHHLALRVRRAPIEPMLPALVRSTIFFFTLAMPFVAALLTR
jgi:hypothetical protein